MALIIGTWPHRAESQTAPSPPASADLPPAVMAPPPAELLPPVMEMSPAESPPPVTAPSVAPPAGGIAAPTLPVIPEARPRPAEGAGSVNEFVESLSTYAATFQIFVGQGRILTTREDLTVGEASALIAVGDPSVIDFIVVSPRQIRIIGQRIGVTDLSVTTADGRTYDFEVHVVADLSLLSSRLKLLFPDASLRLTQVRNNVVVEGQARDAGQASRIIRTVEGYVESIQADQTRQVQGTAGGAGASPAPPAEGEAPPAAAPAAEPPPPAPAEEVPPDAPAGAPPPAEAAATAPGSVAPEIGAPPQVTVTAAPLRVINLIRVPGSQQVLLKVRVAELNRTAARQIGANFLGVDPDTGAIVGTQIAAPVNAISTINRTLTATATAPVTSQTTVFGIFQDGDFEFTLNALRRNSMLRVLAEPNLVALSGHTATFLAGGEFPVPVPQTSGAGTSPTITVQFKEFGVRLGFQPLVLDDGAIRLSVVPEVSEIDFTIATTLVAGGTPVPGLRTRRSQTTVEMKQGQTLAIAGLLQLTLDGATTRIPGLGDLPILGPFFSNTTGNRLERELVVLVTPYLVEAINADQVLPGPGDEVKEPNDLEFFFLNRIEGRTGKDFRSTTRWDDPLFLVRRLLLEKKYLSGPSGFSE